MLQVIRFSELNLHKRFLYKYPVLYIYIYIGGKQWQPTPKKLPRMQCARAIPVAWLGSGSCQSRPSGWILMMMISLYVASVKYERVRSIDEKTLKNGKVQPITCHEGTQIYTRGRSRWPLGLRRDPAATRLLGLRVWIPPDAWSVRRADHSSRGVLSNMACLSVISEP